MPVSCKVCGRLGSTSFCPEHKPAPFGADKPEAERVAAQPWRKGYRDPNYHRERQAVLNRAAGRCEKCAQAAPRLEVDHIIPLSTARTEEELRALNVRSNLVALCVPCHQGKTARDRARRRRG